MLTEIFGMDMTTAMRTCGGCGEPNPVAAHRLYLAAGYVLRCPSCSDVAVMITTVEDRHVVHLTGTWSLATPRGH